MEDFNLIYSYTRAQSIADGVLVDISQEAQALGFRVPVAVTGTLYNKYIECSDYMKITGENTIGRLCELLESLIKAIRDISGSVGELHFQFSVEMKGAGLTEVPVWACVNFGDSGERVITIMLEGED